MKKNLRKEDRIPVENLPECLRMIYFEIGDFGEFPATTVDASKSGMSFVAAGTFERNIEVGRKLIIHIKPHDYFLKAIIMNAIVIFHEAIGEDILRFGVMFEKGESLKKYHDLIKV